MCAVVCACSQTIAVCVVGCRERCEESLDVLVPPDPNHPYDMHEVIDKIVDDANFFEIMPDYARNLIVGFARFEGVRPPPPPPAALTTRAQS